MKAGLTLTLVISTLLFAAPAYSAVRVLSVDSCHAGYTWRDGIAGAIYNTFQDSIPIACNSQADTITNTKIAEFTFRYKSIYRGYGI